MNVYELTNKLQNALNKSVIKNDLGVIATELLETIKIIENCTSCKKKKIDGNYLNKIDELENEKLFRINIILNKKALCEGCKGKKIKKLTDKCWNEEIARFLYKCKLNAEHYDDDYIRWI